MIAAIGRERYGGPLVNATDGGEGGSGVVWTAEMRSAKSLAAKQYMNDPAVKAKCATRLGIKDSEESKELKRRKMLELYEREPWRRQQIADSNTGRKCSAETKDKLRVAQKVADERDPDWRRRAGLKSWETRRANNDQSCRDTIHDV